MSLFTNLLNLHSQSKPMEDFFTEVISYFFSINNDLLLKWLKTNSIVNSNGYSEISISTQKDYKPLATHDYGSRPDILIEMSDGLNNDVVFIESKIGSSEGEKQLKRYSQILASLPNVRHRFLIYITRDYEPKDESEILDHNSSGLVRFHHFRWHEFYQFLLREESNDTLSSEILNFMKENNMSQNNQFSSVDLLSMANFRKALSLMEATLDDEVRNRFNEIFGSSSKPSASLTQFRNHGRYIIYTNLSSYHFWCGIGYFGLNSYNLADYPSVGVTLEVSPNFDQRPKIIQTMLKTVNEKSNIWTPYKLNDSNAWSSISHNKSIKDFLLKEDHLSAIKEYFLDSLNEIESLKNNHPHLPWSGSNIDEE